MIDKQPKVPSIAKRFFKWYCQPSKFEELHGDLEELFYIRTSSKGVRYAQLLYYMDVMRCFQPYAWKRPMKVGLGHIMIANYSKTTLRSLLKNPLSTIINVLGLAVAIGICLVVYAFLSWDASRDQFHLNKNEVHLVTTKLNMDGKSQRYGTSPLPLATALSQDFPQIKMTCRVDDHSAIVKRGEHVFHENIRFTDPSFLDMFTFPLKWGDAETLSDVNSIILSEKMSSKYFGDENSLGMTLQVQFDKKVTKTFKIAGVAASFPDEHVIGFDFLVGFENLASLQSGFREDNWSKLIKGTLVWVDTPAEIFAVGKGMAKYKDLQSAAEIDWDIESFSFEPIATLRSRSSAIRGDISFDDTSEGRLALPIIAGFMLLLACFNYINIAIVSAARRLKEIGVRKVIGATRSKVILQFLLENIFVTAIALILGILLALTLFLPWFMQMSDFPLRLQFFDLRIWLFIIGLLVLTGFISGIYPAFYISSFAAVKIFKGSLRFGKKNLLTKVFLAAQIILACVCVIYGVTFVQNISYQKNRNWGYNPDGVLYTSLPDKPNAYEQLKAKLSQIPDVLKIVGSEHHLGISAESTIIRLPNRSYSVNHLAVDAGYFETLDLKIAVGRAFDPALESDASKAIINELMVENLDLGDYPIGQLIKIDGSEFEIIGVSEQFHANNFYYEVLPTIFTLADLNSFKYLTMRVAPGEEDDVYTELQLAWAELFPQSPFVGGHQLGVWGMFWEQVDIMARFARMIAFIAVFLASMGLYGLVRLNILGRFKEFSIKKILGATVQDFIESIFKQYISITLFSLMVGLPLGYILCEYLLHLLYAYPMPTNTSSLFISTLILVLVLTIVIASQIRKVTISDPRVGLNTK